MRKLETAIMIKAINAKNGIVTNPNQLIYCPVHGTTPHESEFSPMNETF